jgi:hypothetical protein
MNRRERIVAVYLLGLRGHEYRTPEEIRNVTGLPLVDVKAALATLFKIGMVVKASDGEGGHYQYRAKHPRCESRHREGKRSWRCTKEQHHNGLHLNSAGGRRWL